MNIKINGINTVESILQSKHLERYIGLITVISSDIAIWETMSRQINVTAMNSYFDK